MPEPLLPRGQEVAVGEHRIHYLSYGEGPAVAFLHGSGPGASGYSNFKQNIDAIVAAGRRAIVFDMIGFGHSSKPVGCDYTTDLFARTIRQALDAISVGRCVLVGNSLGGAVAIRIALDDPERVEGLVLMAPGGIEESEVYYAMPGIRSMVSAFVGGTLDREGLRSLLRMLVHDASLVDDGLVDERFEVLRTQPVEVLSRLKVPSMAHELGNIRCPILGFWGREDQFTPMSGFSKFLDASPDCAFTLLSNCGHWVMVEQAGLFNAHLQHFLTARMGAARQAEAVGP
ncbi:alpha/beta fold hydrolase [Rhizorhabdus wittichii]|uniref:alpha/beta fold hydrolase n=1 Tax=Rhizorhabdus wittichii TaxID=160791 RepID=UPI000304045A|nr:alpha/beta fold hydrolase [Rhizorhabdus wittichii]